MNSLVAIHTVIGKYSVLPGPAIYPAAVLDGLSRYVRALCQLWPCLCSGTTSTTAAKTRSHGSRPTDDLNPSRVSRVASSRQV